MLVHYRLDGHARRTLCGARWPIGRRPRLLHREWSAVSPPSAPADVESRLGAGGVVACPACLVRAAEVIRLGQERAKQGPKPRPRPVEEDWGDEPDL